MDIPNEIDLMGQTINIVYDDQCRGEYLRAVFEPNRRLHADERPCRAGFEGRFFIRR